MGIYNKIISCGIWLFIIGCSGGDIIIDDFASGTFDKWTVEGDAFGDKPAEGAYPGQMEVTGFEGKYLANSFFGGDDSYGMLISNEFTIERNHINFLIGGGRHDGTYMELMVDGESVIKSRPVTESETLQLQTWDVKDFRGKNAFFIFFD